MERELGVFVDEQYPLMKFFNQVEELNKFRQKEAEEYERARRR